MIKLLRRRLELKEERGAALVWVAGSLVMLLAFSALAVDLAWIYLNSSRLQNASDAAALAGVVNLPGAPDVAQSDAEDAAGANGFPVGGANTVTATPLSDNSLEATLTTSVPTYFLKVLGFNSIDVTRRSTAQYVKPVPLGSPSSCFGIGSLSSVPGCTVTAQQNFWAAINGWYTAREHGDPFAPRCDWGASPGNCADSTPPPPGSSPWDANASPLNPQFRDDGYYYAVEIPSGKTSFTVQLYDAGWTRDRANCFPGPSNPSLPGDTLCLNHSAEAGPTMHYQLYEWDTTPLIPFDNSNILCSRGIAPDSYPRNTWTNLCTISGAPVDPGIYVLKVWVDGNGGGNNGYGLNVVTSPGGGARLYGINDISIFTNQTATGNLTIAEVAQEHAGKILELSFYDPGEDNDDAFMTVKMPDGTSASCSWIAKDFNDNTSASGGPGTCRIQTAEGSLPASSKSLFNGQWITATIDIPDAYTCSSNCWWSMLIEHSSSSTSHDRTTWAARIIGNPVRLVPNP
jgi:hypothetical protein